MGLYKKSAGTPISCAGNTLFIRLGSYCMPAEAPV
jgi:hypothetical protein